MDYSISKCKVNGTIRAPASKSFTIRAYAAALLSNGISRIYNPSSCADSLAALNIIERLGAKYKKIENCIEIKGGMNPIDGEISCGESGLCINLFTPIAALSGKNILLTGKETLLKRPVPEIESVIRALGAECITNNNYPPINISGNIKAGEIEIDGSSGSQFLTGLLFAMPLLAGDSIISVKNLKSGQYVDMTIQILEKFGIGIKREGCTKFFIDGNSKFRASDYYIEGDWSGAAFMAVAGAIGGQVTISGLNVDSHQPDRAIIDALKQAGAGVIFTQGIVEISQSRLKSFKFDATNCPDLFPPLAALAVNCEGITEIIGTNRLIHKESDRASVLKEEFTALGADIELKNNSMIIKGSRLAGAKVKSHNDHRIAMALAVAGINSSGKVIIENPECVNKSYPKFFDDLAIICH